MLCVLRCVSVCTDPDGLPKLAEKQKKYLDRWVRPDDICEDPKMVYLISSFTVKQVRVCTYRYMHTIPMCYIAEKLINLYKHPAR